MRKYKRAIARHAMKQAGIERMNKPPVKGDGSKSFFALNWQDALQAYVDHMAGRSAKKRGKARKRFA